MSKAKSLFILLLISTTSAYAYPHKQTGIASWYGPGFYGHRTASGAIYTGRRLTAAHNTLPLGSRARITNLANHRSVIVIITDRGNFGHKYHRLIDVSAKAANVLHMRHQGQVKVSIVALHG